MPERIFGAIKGAGTQLNEVAGQEEISRGRIGTTVLIAPFERGDERDITICPSRPSFDRKLGGLLDPADFNTPDFVSFYGPLNARHFFNRSKGAGTLICLRATPTRNEAGRDDRPTKSTIPVFNREEEPKLIGQIEAHNGGAWGGKRKTYLGIISGVPGVDFPAANQIQLDGTTGVFQIDEFKNGTVYLKGLPGESYNITENDNDGLITLEPDDDVQTDWGAGETYGSEDSSLETFNFSPISVAWTIGVETETGGPDVATMTATAASVGGDGAPTTPVGAGDVVFQVTQGGVTTEYTVSFNGEASLTEILATINASLPGCSAQDAGAGECIVYTDQQGTGAAITINDSASTLATVTDVFSVGTPTETAGTGDVVNHFAVTAAEVAAAINGAIAASGASASASGGICTITTGTVGSAGWIRASGNLLTVLGYDGNQHFGTDGPSDLEVTLVRDNYNSRDMNKYLSVEFKNGGLRPDTEFGLFVTVDGQPIRRYENLSMETGKSNYWIDTVNDDPNNDIIRITDVFSGDRTRASARPANHYGDSADLSETVLTIADPHVSNLSVSADWVPSISSWSWGTDSKQQKLSVEVTGTGPTALSISTDIGNETWTGNVGAPIDMDEYVGTVTISETGVSTVGDSFEIYVNPLVEDELIGGYVFPNVEDVAHRNKNFQIIDNDVSTVTVSGLYDLTSDGAYGSGKEYKLEYRQQGSGGYDGNLKNMPSSDIENLLDSSSSPLRKLRGKGYGLVKIGVPGAAQITDGLDVSKKLKQFSYDMNWMDKIEIPESKHDWDVYTEQDLVDWVENTLVRDDTTLYSSTHFPCFGYINDPYSSPDAESRLRLVPLMGMILGEEARIAQRRGGYHKAPAGVDAKLPDIVKLPVIGKPESADELDHEILNPSGINILKWNHRGTSIILWGDRTLSRNAVFKFYHKRTMLSHYEIDLLEGFDFTIFDINDSDSDSDIIAALHDYFMPEWRPKRAIRGDSFTSGTYPAAVFNMGLDINTDAVRAAGDVKVEISLRLADVIERLRIFIGPMGLIEGSI